MTVKDEAKKEPQGLIGRAMRYAQKAHAPQKRKSGEPYFAHVLATAEILREWNLDDPTIVAGLLHDTVEDTGVTLEEIKKEFGNEVAFLVDGVTKLGRIKYRGTEATVENLRKMIVALSEDLRVVFVKLADRLHNMRTLSALPPQKQKRIALETYEIYAPLAYRLGMQQVSGELQDLAFPYLYPKENRWLEDTIAEEYAEREKYLAKMKPMVEKALLEHDLKPLEIDFRAKRKSSLYHKLLRHEMNLENIHDLVAFRIIFARTEDCYAALGVIHQLWPPLPGRIKDYIAMPKPNGYRSLHTTIIGPDHKIVEFQIRTKDMHELAEQGIAAHWAYSQSKQGGVGTKQRGAIEELPWVQDLRRWQETQTGQHPDADSFLEAMKVDFFKNRIFAITPRGEVIDMPVGATPVDFAYQIHTDIGNSCVGAKVNHRIVPLNHELHSGDLVEIISQKNKQPSEDWLGFVKTSQARDRIRAALRKKHTTLSRKEPTKSELKIVARDRLGLFKDTAAIINRSHVNIVSVSTLTAEKSGFAVVKILCETADKSKLDKIVLKLKQQIQEIKEISYKLTA